ncbi:MAG: CYTH domain-containing protein [Paramuribaculum sp.]|nr:CYTH domain-containing protein [Paramuribaculum sp.]
MGKEIERKYIVNELFDTALATESHHIIQGYLSVTPESTVRVRIIDDKAYLTVKSKNKGATRNEWEYPLPVKDATEMLDECSVTNIIDKTRYIVNRWEVDIFHRSLEGLRLAEIELTSENEAFETPVFIGKEVTADPRYYNSVLSDKGKPE